MQQKQFIDLVEKILAQKAETPDIELKAAKVGAPDAIYDSLSSFSNTTGGIIIYGINEKDDYNICGVKDPAALEKRIVEQANEMEPTIRPIINIFKYKGKYLLAIEVPELDTFNKPCFYKGKGKFKGSYIRVGEADLPMTEYEIYSYDAFKHKAEDELRTNSRLDINTFNENFLNSFISKATIIKPNLMNLDKLTLSKINGFLDNKEQPTICGIMLFGKYPQLISPNLDIIAVKCSTNEYGIEDSNGVRFIDNKRLDGSIPQMLQAAINFIQSNMKRSTVISKQGKREDVSEYPLKAIREIVLNALIHRDYSIHTENEPIRIIMYNDRIEISNPGGLYGRLTLDELGKTKSDVRNPFIAAALEIMEVTENRYSGIPTIYSEMKTAGLLSPKFENSRGSFKVTLFNEKKNNAIDDDFILKITAFCSVPRSKNVLAKEFGFDEKHPSHFINNYILPLIEKGILAYTLPNKPKSKFQRIVKI